MAEHRESDINLMMPERPWWRIVGPGHIEGTWTPHVEVDPPEEFFVEDRLGQHHAGGLRQPWGNEHSNPAAWCRSRFCDGGGASGTFLHLRYDSCPPYHADEVGVVDRRVREREHAIGIKFRVIP